MFTFRICSFILGLVVAISSDGRFDSAAHTLEFVNTVQSKLQLTNNPNIILVIGNTGSGKSTLVHYVAGGFSKMISKESSNPNAINYEIEDGLDSQSGIITLATESRTFVPEMMVDEEQNVWYDCPGFHDTRNETVEIATTFLIRSVVESASSVKLVLVIDHASVTNGNSRSDFDELLARTAQLLKRVSKFEESISLVVTKVPPRGKRYAELFENSVKNTSAQFMIDHRSVLLRSGMNEKKILLINALLKSKSNAEYPRISVFWRPDDVGAFDKLEKLVSGRHSIRDAILRHIRYTNIRPDDFGFPLSGDAQLHVRNMIEQLADNILAKLRNVSNQLQDDFNKRIESEGSYLNMFDRIDLGRMRLQYPSRSDSISLRNLTDRFGGIIEGSSLPSIDIAVAQIERDENNLNTLASILKAAAVNRSMVFEPNLPPKIDYNSFLDQINDFFNRRETEVQSDLMNEAHQTIQMIAEKLTYIDTCLVAEIRNRLENTLGFHDKLNVLQLGRQSIQPNRDATSVGERLKQFATLIYGLNVTGISASDINRTAEHILHVKAMKSASKQEIIVPVRDWIANSSSAFHLLSVEHGWYSFLLHVYEYLASYEVQRNVAAYNVAELSNWGTPNKPLDLLITSTNFNEFTRIFGKMGEFESTPSRLNDLNKVIKTTIKSTPKYHCKDEVMTIAGNFVRSSDIQLAKCPSITALKRLNVFAVDRFYVDSDLNLNGFENVELHILANQWIIVAPATFHLNGFNGTSQTTPPTTNGTAGRAGDPGMNSGNFFGLASSVQNGSLLTVELIGGNGGNGQDGTGNEDVILIDEMNGNKTDFADFVFDERYPMDELNACFKIQSENYTLEIHRINKTFADSVLSESYFGSLISHLRGKRMNVTLAMFVGRCCGATGTGGSGGTGGETGYYEFIQTTSGANNLPIRTHRKGGNGHRGKNGRLCKTTGGLNHISGIYKGLDKNGEPQIDDEKKFCQIINDHHCPDQYVSSQEITSNPPRDSYVARTIIEYKRFLRANMANPVVFQIIQNAYDAI